MSDDRIMRLTDAERECLRLVADHRQAKEIARDLGISEAAVKQRLKSARQRLGVDSSVEAARRLARHEEPAGAVVAAETPYPSRIYTPGVVVPEEDRGILAASLIDHDEGEASGRPLEVGEARAAFRGPVPIFEPGFPLPFPTRGRPRNDLTWWQIIAYGVGLAFLSALLVSAGFNLLNSIQAIEAHPRN